MDMPEKLLQSPPISSKAFLTTANRAGVSIAFRELSVFAAPNAAEFKIVPSIFGCFDYFRIERDLVG